MDTTISKQSSTIDDLNAKASAAIKKLETKKNELNTEFRMQATIITNVTTANRHCQEELNIRTNALASAKMEILELSASVDVLDWQKSALECRCANLSEDNKDMRMVARWTQREADSHRGAAHEQFPKLPVHLAELLGQVDAIAAESACEDPQPQSASDRTQFHTDLKSAPPSSRTSGGDTTLSPPLEVPSRAKPTDAFMFDYSSENAMACMGNGDPQNASADAV
ncbi:hypothetical protein DOTSEDRAFT_53460 [Dothistroma septosporum NZE10]|uniref:Uncharacterized protein n=1 Tax=Dothistroma septosporum (strain NZE10 / CBS 128990) TaxID=675120 RepID=N1PLD7_DOTSN|nr:hypothetical protein DOTSEDRAFT_53460 [Dothistroma septosporum NZE10]